MSTSRPVGDEKLEQRLKGLKPGDHLCCIYETDEEHRAVLTPFMTQGLEAGEKVAYILDVRTAEDVLGYFQEGGMEVAGYLRTGQLTLISAAESYTREPVFDPDRMISFLADETERALAQGYSALRVTGELTWALKGFPGSDRLNEYEAKLNEFFPRNRCLAICQYDRRRFDSEVLLDVLATHPRAIVGTRLFDNFYYMPPMDVLGAEPATARLNHCLNSLEARRRTEDALRESQETTRALLNAPSDVVALLAKWSKSTRKRIRVRCGSMKGLEGMIVKRTRAGRSEIVFDSFPAGVTVRVNDDVLEPCD